MNITEFVNGVQTFKKKELIQLVTVLKVTASDLLDNIERMQANKISLDSQINQWAVTKSIVRAMDDNGYRGIGFNKGVSAALHTVKSLSDQIETMITKDKDQTWDGKLINLRQANILMTIEQMDHWLKYTSLAYDVLISLNNKAESKTDNVASKFDLRFLNQTLEYYKGTFLWLLKGPVSIINDLKNIPEVEVSEASMSVMEGSDMRSTLTAQALGIHSFNPYYWYKNSRMKTHIAEIEEIRNNNERFAMKITQAVNKRNGTNDAALDEQIEDYQNRILTGRARIDEIDKMYRSSHG